MSDDWLRHELEALESSAPSELARHPRDPSRVARIAVVAAMAVVVLMVAVGVPALQPTAVDPSPLTSASSTGTPDGSPIDTAAATPSMTEPAIPSATASSSPAPSGPLAWHLVQFPGDSVRDISVDGRWIAVTETGVWTSDDGVEWHPGEIERATRKPEGCDCPDFDGFQPSPTAVVTHKSAHVAIGYWVGFGDDLHPVAWRSGGGTAFHELDVDWRGYGVLDVASNGAVLVATQHDYGDGSGSVWTSNDGLAWSEHTSPVGRAAMTAIWGDEDGFIAVGHRRVDDETTPAPAIWVSRDGTQWSEASLAGPGAELRYVTRDSSGRYHAIGFVRDGERSRILAWRSDDGSTWTGPVEVGRTSRQGDSWRTTGGLVESAGELVFVASGDGMIEIWTSADSGDSWSYAGPLVVNGIQTAATAVASDGDKVVVMAASELSGEAETTRHMMWIGRREE